MKLFDEAAHLLYIFRRSLNILIIINMMSAWYFIFSKTITQLLTYNCTMFPIRTKTTRVERQSPTAPICWKLINFLHLTRPLCPIPILVILNIDHCSFIFSSNQCPFNFQLVPRKTLCFFLLFISIAKRCSYNSPAQRSIPYPSHTHPIPIPIHL